MSIKQELLTPSLCFDILHPSLSDTWTAEMVTGKHCRERPHCLARLISAQNALRRRKNNRKKKSDFHCLAITVALGDWMELLLKVSNVQGKGKWLFNNKSMAILGVIFIALYKAGLHFNLEFYFFFLYHKNDIIEKFFRVRWLKMAKKRKVSFGVRPLWYF